MTGAITLGGRRLSRTPATICALGLIIATGCVSAAPSTRPNEASLRPSASAFVSEGGEASGPPGPPPSPGFLPPTPDPNLTSPPFPSTHADTALEALVGIELGGVKLTTTSFAGEEAAQGGRYLSSLLAVLDKTTADLSSAVATDPSGRQRAVVFALRIRGADPERLLQVFLAVTANDQAEQADVGGKRVRRIPGNWTSYVYASGDTLIVVQSPESPIAEEALSRLP